jgi:hypothetical protein
VLSVLLAMPAKPKCRHVLCSTIYLVSELLRRSGTKDSPNELLVRTMIQHPIWIRASSQCREKCSFPELPWEETEDRVEVVGSRDTSTSFVSKVRLLLSSLEPLHTPYSYGHCLLHRHQLSLLVATTTTAKTNDIMNLRNGPRLYICTGSSPVLLIL